MVLYMINYPTIQQKIREEIESVCGDSLPSLAHRARWGKIASSIQLCNQLTFIAFHSLPFTDAFITEVMRMSSVAPLGVPHLAMKETQLLGFTIPKVLPSDIEYSKISNYLTNQFKIRNREASFRSISILCCKTPKCGTTQKISDQNVTWTPTENCSETKPLLLSALVIILRRKIKQARIILTVF